MALTVDTNGVFLEAVRTSLQLICPNVVVKDTGEVTVTAGPCTDYCDHIAGCNLLADLVDPALPTIVITEDIFSSSYHAPSNQIEWRNDGNGKETCDDADCTGSGEHNHPKTAILAHELIHAWHHLKTGTYSISKIDYEEHCTVCAENQIRSELGVVQRCRYDQSTPCLSCSADALTDMETYGYACKLLDTGSRRTDCNCTAASDVSAPDESPESETSDAARSPESGESDGEWPGCGCLLSPFFRLRDLLVERSNPMPVEGGVPPRRSQPRGLVPDDWLQQSQFEELLRSQDPLGEELRRAARELVMQRNAESSPEIEAFFRQASEAAILELVDLHGAYRVILFAVSDDSAVFATNIELELSSGRPILGAPRDLRLFTLPSDMATTVQQALRSPIFGPAAEGTGGRIVADGQAQFLRVKVGGTIHRTAARAFRFGADPGDISFRPKARDDEGPRWDAIKMTMNLGLDALRELGEPVILRRSSG